MKILITKIFNAIFIGVVIISGLLFGTYQFMYYKTLSELPIDAKGPPPQSDILESRYLDVWWKAYRKGGRKERSSFGVLEYYVRVVIDNKNRPPEFILYPFVAQQRIYTSSSRKPGLRRPFSTLVLANWLSENWEVDETISYMLNHSYFGAGAYGIENASRQYFCKDYKELKTEEIALLVGLLKSPSFYNPYRNPDRCLARANMILSNISPDLILESLPGSLCNSDTIIAN